VVEKVRFFNTGAALNSLFEILRRSVPEGREAQAEHTPIGDPADGITTEIWDLKRHQGLLKMVRDLHIFSTFSSFNTDPN
jgi:hypothetical protein